MHKITKCLLILALMCLPWAARVNAQCDEGVAQCEITFQLTDQYGDGWNGNSIEVYQGTTLRGTVTLDNGTSGEATVAICTDEAVCLVWSEGSWSSETSFTVLNGDETAVVSNQVGSSFSNGDTIALFTPLCATCIKPSHLTFADVDTGGATISWTAGGEETSWLLTIGDATYEVSANSYTATGLNAMTTYSVSVRALCSDNDTSAALAGSFTTACGIMTLPFFTDWEGVPYNGAWPDCWNLTTAYNTDPSVNYENNHTPGGQYSMFLMANYGYNMFASSKIPLPGNEIYVSYYAYLNSYSAIIEAGVMTDPYADSTFIPLDSITSDNATTYAWIEREFNTSHLDPAQEYYLAFRAYGTSGWSAIGHIDDITIDQYSGCERVAAAFVDSVDSYSATLRWNAVDGASAYTVVYSTENDINSDMAQTEYVGDTAITLSLDPQTTYYAWVLTECGSATATARQFQAFRTGCAEATCDITLIGEASYYYYCPGAIVWQDGAEIGRWQDIGSQTIEVCDNDTVTITYLAPDYTWGSGKLTILDGGNAQIFSSGDGGYTDGQVIVTLPDACPSCIPPAHFRSIYRSDDSIVVAWEPRSEEGEWLLWLDSTFVGNATDTFYVFQGLEANTSYSIALQSVCSSDDSSSVLTLTAKTACTTMTIPYFEDWEGIAYNGAWPDCWDRVLAHNTDPSVNSQRNHTDGGQYSMYLAASYDYNMFASGMVPLPGDGIKVAFWAYIPTGGSLRAGVMSNPDDTGTFIPLLFIDDATNAWNEYEFNTSTLDGYSNYYVAFRYYGESTWSYGAIDDIAISEYSPCERPASAWASTVTEYEATINWNTVDVATSYVLYYNTANDIASATSVIVYDTTMQLGGLLPQTTYYAWVATSCGGETSGDYRNVSPFTTLTTCVPVVGLVVENVSYTAAQVSWQYDLSAGFTPTGAQVTLIDNSDPANVTVSYEAGSTATFLGLLPNHSYTAMVRTMCQTDYQVDTAAAYSIEIHTLNCPGSEISSATSSANATSNPLNNYYNYSYAQNLYLASEMPTVDTIRGIGFRTSGSDNRTVNLDIYMGNTALTALSTTQFVSAADMTLMASGHQMDLGTAGWHYITFATPFVWDGTSNLVVAIDNNTGSYSTNLSWYTHATSDNQSAWSYGDGVNFDPSAITSLSNTAASAADIQLMVDCDVPTCEAPMLSIADVDSMGFTATWVPLGEATTFAIQLDGVPQQSTTSTSLQLQNLQPNTVYTLAVGAVCTTSSDTIWSIREVKTMCGNMMLPYIEDFESDTEGEMVSCWSTVHDYTYSSYYAGSTHYPMITDEGIDASHALALCAYGTCMVATQAIPNSGLQGDQYHITFYAKLANSNCSASAGVMTSPAFDTTYTQLVDISNDDQWHRYDIYTTGLNPSESYHFAIRYDGTYSYSDSYQLHIDDLSISIDSGCHFATALSATATANSATLHWTNDGQTSNFVVAYRPTSSTTFTYANAGAADSIVLNGLQAASTYLFRVGNICSNGDTLWTDITAQTDCGAISLPYFEDFTSETIPPCYVVPTTGVQYFDGGLFWSSNTGPSYPAVLPDFNQPISKLEIEFKTKVGPVSQGDAILVGVADASGSFIQWLDTLTDPNQSRSAFVWMTYRYNTYSGTGTRIALGRLYTGGDWALVDDITVRQIPSCSPADSIAGHNLGDPDSSYFTWSNMDGMTDFQVFVDTVTTDTNALSPASLISVSGNSYLIPTGILSGGGKYKFFIRTDCGNSYSPWKVVTFGAGEFIMSQSGTDTLTSCGLVIYDNGGPIAGYYSGTSSSVVIYPSDSQSRLQIYGAYLSLYNDGNSTLTIFDGVGEAGSILYQTSYSGPTTMYDSIVTLPIATSTSGPLTIRFTAGTYVNPGYELYVRCIPIATCDDPTYIQATAIAANSATLSWYGNAPSYNIYYRTYGSTQWSMASSNTPGTTLNGLLNATTYEVQIRAICSDDDSSNLSTVLSFTTECDVVQIAPSHSLVEDFEGIQVPSSCWQLVYGSTGGANENPVIFDAAAAHSGAQGLRFSSANMNSNGNYNQTLITPELSSDDAMSVLFWVRASQGTESFRVGYSTTTSEQNAFTWQTPLIVGDTWLQYRLDLPSNTKHVAVNYMSGAPRHHLYVDSLVVAVNDGSVDCAEPIITATTSTASTITVNYLAIGSVEGGIVEGSDWDDNATLQTLPNGTSYTFDHLFSDNSPLQDSSVYTIALRSICGEDRSDWVVHTVVTRALECNTPTNVIVNVVDGTTAQVSWDANGASAWEVNYGVGNNTTTLDASTTSLTLYDLTHGATYSLRVRAICGQSQSSWSEAVTFVPTECHTPMGLSTSEITSSSAHLSWSSSDATEWEIAYGFSSSFDIASAQRLTVTSNEYTLTGLTRNSDYTWAVRATCSDGEQSNWSGRINFTTLGNEGIDDVETARVTIHPNPTSGLATITINGAMGEATVTIVDLNGHVVGQYAAGQQPSDVSVITPSSTQTLTVDLSGFASGTYFIRISDKNGLNQVKKIIVK